MTAFTPISPKAAAELMSLADVSGLPESLADFSAGGLARTYARIIETVHTGGQRVELRDATVPRELWRRIIAEAKTPLVWSAGTVRLDGSPHLGTPAVTVTGIRFNPEDVSLLAAQHGSGGGSPGSAPPTPIPPSTQPAPAPVHISEQLPFPSPASESAPATSATRENEATGGAGKKRSPRPSRPPNPDALTCSVDDATTMTGIGRTTLYKRMDEGTLLFNKEGGRRRIVMASLRKLAMGSHSDEED